MLAPTPIPSDRARVLVVDDEPLVCRAVRRQAASYANVVEAHGVGEAVAMLSDGSLWTVIIIDWWLDGRLGAEVLEFARARYPLLACMVLTGAPDGRASEVAWAHGAPLFIKPLQHRVLKAFVAQAAAGRSEFGQAVATKVQRWRVLYGLRPASAEVLRLRAMGESPAGVVEVLGICENTYKKHVRNLLDRTGGDSIEGEVANLLREIATGRSK